MSISVPTATENSSSQPPARDPKNRWRGWVAIASVVTLVVVVSDSEVSAPDLSADAVDAPSVTFPVTPVDSVMPDLSGEVVFPGEGRATAVAMSIHGRVVVGQREGSSFVYTSDPSGDLWVESPLEVSERAWLGTVSPWTDGFVIGGAIVGPGMGSSIPTLWRGDVGSDFVVAEHPFPGPGRIDRVRVIRGSLFLVAQASAPFTETARPGVARFGRLLVGRPDSWSDITPSGGSVLVGDVVGFGDGVVASGGDRDGAVVWWKPDMASEWVSFRLGEGFGTDVISTPTGLVVSVLTTTPDGDVRSRLFRGDGPRTLVAVGSSISAGIGWIAPAGDGLVGGGFPSWAQEGLWSYRFGVGWQAVPLGTARTVARTAHDGAGVPELLVVGSVAGQPAVWTSDGSGGRVLVDLERPSWEFTSLLPGRTSRVVSTGTNLFAFDNTLDVETLWVSTAGRPWRGIETVAGFGFAGATEHPGGWVVFGETGFQGVVYDSDGVTTPDVHVLPGMSIRHAARHDSVLTILGIEDGTPIRLRVGASEERTVLDDLPARIVPVGGLLLGSSFRGDGVTVSIDDGVTWTPLPDVVLPAGTPGERALLISRSGEVLALDSATLALVPTGDRVSADRAEGDRILAWGEGVVVAGDGGLRLAADPVDGSTVVDLDVESGMHGVFLETVPGPGRFALVSDRGLHAIYRWVGMGR